MTDRAGTSSIQFMGVTQVIRAYSNMKVPSWSVCAGKDILQAWSGNSMDAGEKMLSQYLDLLSEGESRGVYTLRIYDKAPKEIRSNTEYYRSFRFMLQDPSGFTGNRFGAGIEKVIERLDRIEARQALIESEEEKEETVGGVQGFLSGLLENDQVKQALGAGIAKVIELITQPLLNMNQNQSALPQPAAIGNAGGAELAQDQIAKVEQALATLANIDPKLGDHLQAIADIAATNPNKYNTLIGMLKLL
jgi:hypothetical protein